MLNHLLSRLTPAVKLLLGMNIALFLASLILEHSRIDLPRILGLHYFQSDLFAPYQLLTSLFIHAGFAHFFFNMYALSLFGSTLERIWGARRLLLFYLLCGLGASLLHGLTQYWEFQQLLKEIPVGETASEMILALQTQGRDLLLSQRNWLDRPLGELNLLYNGYAVGASGAVYGLLLGFGVLFPNAKLTLIFIPAPIKAKYFIPICMLIELFLGVSDFQWDNIAHFAHLGGAIVGFVLVIRWRSQSTGVVRN